MLGLGAHAILISAHHLQRKGSVRKGAVIGTKRSLNALQSETLISDPSDDTDTDDLYLFVLWSYSVAEWFYAYTYYNVRLIEII